MKILISGSSGLIGTAIRSSLQAQQHDVLCLKRDAAAVGGVVWNPEAGDIHLEGAKDINVVIHLAGENIASGRWTARKKQRIIDSRVKGTELLAKAISQLDPKPSLFISASAIGYYGSRGDMVLDESSTPDDSFLSDLCQQWEQATRVAQAAGIRVVQIRIGVVLSATGGALKKMLLPFRLGLGGVIGSGKQFMSWITIDDVVGAVGHLIANEAVSGPVNLVSPEPVSNHQFTKTFGSVLRRPTIFPMPAFAARLAFGQMADELLLASTRVMPVHLQETGYCFQHTKLNDALTHVLER